MRRSSWLPGSPTSPAVARSRCGRSSTTAICTPPAPSSCAGSDVTMRPVRPTTSLCPSLRTMPSGGCMSAGAGSSVSPTACRPDGAPARCAPLASARHAARGPPREPPRRDGEGHRPPIAEDDVEAPIGERHRGGAGLNQRELNSGAPHQQPGVGQLGRREVEAGWVRAQLSQANRPLGASAAELQDVPAAHVPKNPQL